MSAIPIQIGAHSFATKSEAKNHARHILNRYREHDTITGQDDLFLRDLISIHPEASQKIGCGIEFFTSQIDPVWHKTRHFLIIRIDGSQTDFSFHTCIDGTNDRKDVLHALRHAIADQIIHFQLTAFASSIPCHCPYTGQLLSPSSVHVDHRPPNTFLFIATLWMQQQCLDYQDIPLVDNADNQWVRSMCDMAQKNSWRQFHEFSATLRLISPIANLSHVKRESHVSP